MSAHNPILECFASPCCQAKLQFQQERLTCSMCGLGYPVRGDISVLLTGSAGRFCERCRRWRALDSILEGRCPDCLDTI